MEALFPDVRLSRRGILIASIFCLAVAAWMAYDMARLPLWGWRPLFLELACWGLILFPFFNRFSRHPSNGRFLVAATISGLLFSFSFPVYPLTPLVFLAWIPLIWMEDQVSNRSSTLRPWTVWKYGFHAFLIWNVVTTFWVVNTALAAGLIANFLNAILMATVFMACHIVKHYAGRRWQVLILLSFWISFEYLHLFWDITWPWLTLGNSFAMVPSFVQWYEYTGVFGGSVWVIVLNFMIYQWIVDFRKGKKGLVRSVSGILGLLILPVICSFVLKNNSLQHASDLTPVEVAVVQPNFEPHYQKFEIPEEVQLQRFLSLSDSIVTDSTSYLVFPETSFPYILLNNIDRNRSIRELRTFLDGHPGLRLVAGVASYRIFFDGEELPETVRRRRDGLIYDAQNSAIEIVSGREEIKVYFKSKLTPGAEFFPFKKFLPFIKPVVEQLGGSMGLTTQEEPTVFQFEGGGVAPVICYESVYGAHVGAYVRKGGTMIFIVTNDGWWDDTPGYRQHLAIASLRAIEHRRPVARSANTGSSAFITPEGKILDATKYETATAIRRVLTPRNDLTFYTKWGDYIPRTMAGLVALYFIFTLASWWRKRAGVR